MGYVYVFSTDDPETQQVATAQNEYADAFIAVRELLSSIDIQSQGTTLVICGLPSGVLKPGTYSINGQGCSRISSDEWIDWLNALQIEIIKTEE